MNVSSKVNLSRDCLLILDAKIFSSLDHPSCDALLKSVANTNRMKLSETS